MRFLPSMLALCLSAPLFAGGVSTPQQGHAEILGTLLYTDISVDWQEVSAREAMADIEAVYGIPVVEQITMRSDLEADLGLTATGYFMWWGTDATELVPLGFLFEE